MPANKTIRDELDAIANDVDVVANVIAAMRQGAIPTWPTWRTRWRSYVIGAAELALEADILAPGTNCSRPNSARTRSMLASTIDATVISSAVEDWKQGNWYCLLIRPIDALRAHHACDSRVRLWRSGSLSVVPLQRHSRRKRASFVALVPSIASERVTVRRVATMWHKTVERHTKAVDKAANEQVGRHVESSIELMVQCVTRMIISTHKTDRISSAFGLARRSAI
jgi:hypothetical protein